MTASLELPWLARHAVAEPVEATLLIHGAGRFLANQPRLVMQDENGRPTFVCARDSPVAAAAGSFAVLRLRPRSDGGPVATVVLAGQLAADRTHPLAMSDTAVLTLAAASIVIEQDDPGSPTVIQHTVCPQHYASAGPDALAAAARSLQEHMNDAHQRRLREFAARRAGLGDDQIASAALTDLGRDGARLNWIDTSGAHIAAIVFDRPAHGPAGLARLLHAQLCARR